VFLLVSAYPGCPGPKAVKRLCVSVSSSFVPKDVLEGHLYCWMEWVCAVHGCWEKSFFIIYFAVLLTKSVAVAEITCDMVSVSTN